MSYGFGAGLPTAINLRPITITDFVAGNDGDVLDLQNMILGYYQSPASTTILPAANPFTSGHLRLVQDGADVVVRWDYDGTGGGDGAVYTRDLFRLSGVNLSALTSFNFAGFDPAGAPAIASTISGSAQDDVLVADGYGSRVEGLGGSDRLIGSGGRDDLSGGDGNDIIDGGWNDDVLTGGDGDDVLTDSVGNNRFDGGAGDDIIRFETQFYQFPYERFALPRRFVPAREMTRFICTSGSIAGAAVAATPAPPQSISARAMIAFTLAAGLSKRPSPWARARIGSNSARTITSGGATQSRRRLSSPISRRVPAET